MTVIALGADHAGFPLKEELKGWLITGGHRVVDHGTFSVDPVDYPDYAELVADAVAGGDAELGILVCGTGIGMTMTANKVPGVRAAFCGDTYMARMSREHNDANVLALGARLTDAVAAVDILRTWLESSFLGGRHARRLEKVTRVERKVLSHAPTR